MASSKSTRQHVSPSLDLDQLATMKSIRPQDGAFLTKWLQCPIESQEVNHQRQYCDGIYVHIYENTAGEFIILQIDPCIHGEQHKEANGDFLKYSCRKIKAIFLNDDDLA